MFRTSLAPSIGVHVRVYYVYLMTNTYQPKGITEAPWLPPWPHPLEPVLLLPFNWQDCHSLRVFRVILCRALGPGVSDHRRLVVLALVHALSSSKALEQVPRYPKPSSRDLPSSGSPCIAFCAHTEMTAVNKTPRC